MIELTIGETGGARCPVSAPRLVSVRKGEGSWDSQQNRPIGDRSCSRELRSEREPSARGCWPRPLPAAASGGLTKGDAAILRFLAAAEILETDLWQQYNELAGIQDSEVPGGSGNPAYTEAVAVLDEDMAQYIHDNTDDEISHFTFINAYLKAHGAETVNLDRFRTLPSSTGDRRAADRTADQPDAADHQHQLLDALPQRLAEPRPRRHAPASRPRPRHRPAPGDPAHRTPTSSRQKHLQAIANTAGFHFAWIEQGGTSLYAALAQRVTHREVLRILLSIGGSEIMHFQTWQDKAGNAPPLTDPTTGLTFPDLNADGELTQTNLIMPEPTIFLDRKFPVVSIIRPTETEGAAMGTVKALTDDGLFIGQSPEFFATLTGLAKAADAARH